MTNYATLRGNGQSANERGVLHDFHLVVLLDLVQVPVARNEPAAEVVVLAGGETERSRRRESRRVDHVRFPRGVIHRCISFDGARVHGEGLDIGVLCGGRR